MTGKSEGQLELWSLATRGSITGSTTKSEVEAVVRTRGVIFLGRHLV